MNDFSLFFLFSCFLLMFLYWLHSAFSVKKNKTPTKGWKLRIIALTILIIVFVISKTFVGVKLWNDNQIIMILADVITFWGFIVMILSRRELGKNWSGNIVIKENHELITTGPYKYVRHPIYSGLSLMVIGVSIYSGNIVWILFSFFFLFGSYYFKAKSEEKLLIQNFPEYIEYKKRVKAIIPWVF